MKTNWLKLIFGTSAASLIFGHAFHLAADENELPKRKRVVVVESAPAEVETLRAADTKYWIGIRCEPNDSGVIVEDVVSGSPAEKAGVKANDIINRVNETEIDDVKSLIDVVQKSRGEEIEVEVIRADETVTLKVTPTERPQLRLGDRFKNRPNLRDFFRDFDLDGDLDLHFINPGIIIDDEFPKGTKVEIHRKNDEPAKITIQRDGKKWTVDEKTIDELPEDLRSMAKRMLNGTWGRPRIPNFDPDRLPRFRFRDEDRRDRGMAGIEREMEELRRMLKNNDDPRDKEIAELRKEIKELREMIEKLNK